MLAWHPLEERYSVRLSANQVLLLPAANLDESPCASGAPLVTPVTGAMRLFRQCPRWEPPPLWELFQQQDAPPEELQSVQLAHSGPTSVNEDSGDSSAAMGVEATLAGLFGLADSEDGSVLSEEQLAQVVAAVCASASSRSPGLASAFVVIGRQ